jgi:hypothetical protein
MVSKAITKLALSGISLTIMFLVKQLLTLSSVGFFFWALLIGLLYKIISDAELKYFFSVTSRWQVPTWMYKKILTTYKVA